MYLKSTKDAHGEALLDMRASGAYSNYNESDPGKKPITPKSKNFNSSTDASSLSNFGAKKSQL